MWLAWRFNDPPTASPRQGTSPQLRGTEIVIRRQTSRLKHNHVSSISQTGEGLRQIRKLKCSCKYAVQNESLNITFYIIFSCKGLQQICPSHYKEITLYKTKIISNQYLKKVYVNWAHCWSNQHPHSIWLDYTINSTTRHKFSTKYISVHSALNCLHCQGECG